jgi:hypothetical protein
LSYLFLHGESYVYRTQNIFYILLSELLVETSKSIRIDNSFVQYEEYLEGSEQCYIFNSFYIIESIFIYFYDFILFY